jgi:hypothetical protein
MCVEAGLQDSSGYGEKLGSGDERKRYAKSAARKKVARNG